MQKKSFTSLSNFLAEIADFPVEQLVLFRGQSGEYDLLPKIARKDSKSDATATEKQMLAELRRRGDRVLGVATGDDWELMTLAQHFGMATRFLDWTSNPLVALWFACAYAQAGKPAFVYLFKVKPDRIVDREKTKSPFGNGPTRVFKPTLNNPRIGAQSGWFTSHKHSSKANSYVALQRNPEVNKEIDQFEIHPDLQASLLAQLNMLGVNYQTMFPDVEGLCRHINYLHGH